MNKLHIFNKLKEKFEGKYVKVLNSKDDTMISSPEKHELIYIEKLYQYIENIQTPTELELKLKESIGVDISNIEIQNTGLCIEISEGISIKNNFSMGYTETNIKNICAYIVPVDLLVPIDKEEFDKLYKICIENIENIKFNYYSKNLENNYVGSKR